LNRRVIAFFICALSVAAFFLVATSASAFQPLSTSGDGDFQAIASSPTSIQLFWRHGGGSARIYRDDTLLGEYPADPSSTFSRLDVSDLQPNTRYSFKMGDSGPVVSEKTWSGLRRTQSFDVLVVGGTASGFAAALTAGRLGLRVALVEETDRLGGMASNGLGSTDYRIPSRLNGVFEDFRERIKVFYGDGDGLRYESRVALAIMKDMVYAYPNITLFMKTSATKPIVSGGTVIGASARELATGKIGDILAKVTIDATDGGSLAADAGAEYRLGREPRSDAEPHAGKIYFDDPKQEILPNSTGEGDRKIQSYAYLMLLKDYGKENAPLIAKPRFYDPEIYRHSPEWKSTWAYENAQLPGGKFEINQHPFGTDWPGINFDYPTADADRRREIDGMYRDRALGYLYYIQNEQGYKNIGLADDEFLESGNFPPALYVRESRRIIGDLVLNESDVRNSPKFHRSDSIAIGDYPMDSHAMEDLKDPNRLDKGEGEFWLESLTPWYQIPFGILSPKGIDGLLVSTAVSTTHVGYGTLRMEPIRMSTGQAAAAAAYWSILYSEPVRKVNPAWIQDAILPQGAYINWNSDVDRDTRHFRAINFLGARGVFEGDKFRPDAQLTRGEAFDAIDRMLKLEGRSAALTIQKPESPDSPITRGEFAEWLVLAKEASTDRWTGLRPDRPSYSDVPTDSPRFSAVETLRAHAISSTSFFNPEAGKFRPEDPILRSDAAWAIYLAYRPIAMNDWMP